jgi:hypothetical protein
MSAAAARPPAVGARPERGVALPRAIRTPSGLDELRAGSTPRGAHYRGSRSSPGTRAGGWSLTLAAALGAAVAA